MGRERDVKIQTRSFRETSRIRNQRRGMNVPDQRSRASDTRHANETLPRGSLHPACSAHWVVRK